MKIFKVGGAVRDAQMGLRPKDTDWVVVGSSPEEMIKKGFKQVGKDFPVFLSTRSTIIPEFGVFLSSVNISPLMIGFFAITSLTSFFSPSET